MKTQTSARKLLVSFFKRPENWVNAVALIVTVILSYRSLTTGNVDDYLQAVLAVLSILALSQLAVGYSSILRDREIEELSESMDSLTRNKFSTESFFRTRKELVPLETHLFSATATIDILGVSLTTVTITHIGALKNLTNSGVQIRLIVTDPDNEFLQHAIVTRIVEVETASRHAHLVRTAIENVEACAENIHSGNLQIRVTDHLPSFSYFGIDTMTPKGKINVELYLSKVPLGRNPIFTLDPVTDPRWYNEFRNQFEFFWNSAKELDSKKTMD